MHFISLAEYLASKLPLVLGEGGLTFIGNIINEQMELINYLEYTGETLEVCCHPYLPKPLGLDLQPVMHGGQLNPQDGYWARYHWLLS